MPVIQALIERGDTVTPILSDSAGTLDTRFGTAAHWREELTALCLLYTSDTPAAAGSAAYPVRCGWLPDVRVIPPAG